MKFKNKYHLSLLILVLFSMLGLLVFRFGNGAADLTRDQRFSVDNFGSVYGGGNDVLGFTVLLTGDVPASFQGYRNYIDQYLGAIRREYPLVEVDYKDPNEGTIQESNEFKNFLRSQGVNGLARKVADASEVRQSELFPYILVHYKNRIAFIDLLESMRPGESEQEAIMRSQLGFEAKLLKAVRNIRSEQLSVIRIVGTDSRLLAEGLSRDKRALGFQYISSDAEDIIANSDSTQAVIVIATKELLRKEILALDQVALKNIPVIWFVEKFAVNVDSMSVSDPYLAFNNEFKFEDYLFQLGVKIEPQLVYDLQCAGIPQVVGTQGGQPKTTLLPFPLHPVLLSDELESDFRLTTEPIVSKFVASVDTIQSSYDLDYEVLLSSSRYSRIQSTPASLSFNMLRVASKPEDYDNGDQIIGIEVEGEVRSQYLNRMDEEELQWLSEGLEREPLKEGFIRQAIVADADIILPPRSRNGAYSAIGYDIWERRMYEGNIQFLMNLLEYNVYGDLILDISQREMSSPLLDGQRFEDSKLKYVIVLLLGPIFLILVFSWIYHILRKRKYSGLRF